MFFIRQSRNRSVSYFQDDYYKLFRFDKILFLLERKNKILGACILATQKFYPIICVCLQPSLRTHTNKHALQTI